MNRFPVYACMLLLLIKIELKAQIPLVPSLNDLSESDTKWISKHFTQLDGVEILGIGEVSHGSHEVFSFQSMMIKYLVKEKGFRTLFFEMDDPGLRKVNSYLNSNNPYDKSMIDSLSRQFSTGTLLQSHEIFDLLGWLKKYNINNGNKKIQVRGMDYSVDFHYLRDKYLEPSYYAELKKEWDKKKKKTVNLDEQLHVLDEWFKFRSSALKESMDSSSYVQLIRDLHNFRTAAFATQRGGQSDTKMFTMRDSTMANNISALKYGKAIICGHNLHIANKELVNHKFIAKNLGQFLRENYGNKYYVVLTDYSGRGTINYRTPNGFSQRSYLPNKKSLSRKLLEQHNISDGVFSITDLNIMKLPLSFNNISVEGTSLLMEVQAEAFDALVIFRELTPSKMY